MPSSSVFPTDLDDFHNVTDQTYQDGSTVSAPSTIDPDLDHVVITNLLNDAVAAIEAKIGKDGSDDTTSLDYLVRALQAVAHTHVNAEVPGGAVNGANETFTLADAPSPSASLMLFRNGVLQQAGGNDFTLIGSTITFATAPETGDILLAYYTL